MKRSDVDWDEFKVSRVKWLWTGVFASTRISGPENQELEEGESGIARQPYYANLSDVFKMSGSSLTKVKPT